MILFNRISLLIIIGGTPVLIIIIGTPGKKNIGCQYHMRNSAAGGGSASPTLKGESRRRGAEDPDSPMTEKALEKRARHKRKKRL
jgi:hypothetical protein